MGMFGIAPEEVALLQQQQDVAQATNAAQMPLGSGGVYAASLAGNMIGRGIGGAFGYKDPRVTQAAKMKRAMDKTNSSGIDFSKDPVKYMALGAKHLAEEGLYDQAMAMQKKIEESQMYQVASRNAAVNEGEYGLKLQNLNLENSAGGLVSPILGGLALGQDSGGAQPGPSPDITTEESQVSGKPRWEAVDSQLLAMDDLAAKHPNIARTAAYKEAYERLSKTREFLFKASKEGNQGPSTQNERAMSLLNELQLQAESGKPLTRQQQLQAESARNLLEQQRPFIEPSSGKLVYSQPISVPGSITVGDAGEKPVPNTLPPMTGGRRPLDAGTEKKFTDIGAASSQLSWLIDSFKDEYGGFVSNTAGDLAVSAGRRGLPKYTDMANWVAAYEQWVSKIRAADYGLTLTPGELTQFNKFRIQVGDDPKVMKQNLARQKDVIEGSRKRELKALDASGQNVKHGEALSTPAAKQDDPDKPIVRPANIDGVTGTPLPSAPNTRGGFNFPEGQTQRATPMLPPGVPPMETREIGKKYVTPKGVLRWTEQGWVK